MGVVYRATDTAPGPRGGAQGARRPARATTRSASAGCARRRARRPRLDPPAICVVYEIDEADGATFIAMELVRGRPLVGAGRRAAWSAAARARPRDRGGGGPRGGARARHRAPRPQALERDGHGVGPRQDHRLRPGQATGSRPRAVDSGMDTPPRGAAPIPGASSAPPPTCRPSRCAARDVDPRSDVFSFGAAPLRDAVGRAGVPARDGRRDAARGAQGAGAAPVERGPRGRVPERRSACSTAAWPRTRTQRYAGVARAAGRPARRAPAPRRSGAAAPAARAR